MSIWYEITDNEDISLSDDGKCLQINFDSNHNGNIWVEVSLELIDQLRKGAAIKPAICPCGNVTNRKNACPLNGIIYCSECIKGK